MAEPVPLDAECLRAHPLPDPRAASDKNERGRVLAIGGSRQVPGGLLLTAEAAMRAGAGKIRMATIAGAALPLGIAMPEAAVTALPEDKAGEIAGIEPLRVETEALNACDAVVIGPAMTDKIAAGRLLDALGGTCREAGMVVDATALLALSVNREIVSARPVPAVLTPHPGEMAALLDISAEAVTKDMAAAALLAARRFGAVVAFKAQSTLVATPDGELFRYVGGGVGLATSGSGDVLSGIVAGLAARGASPLVAALWGVWTHGEAGRRAAERIGEIGFLARELLPAIPALVAA